jgi:hypothetical protein
VRVLTALTSAEKFIQNWKDECGGFASPRLGCADDVPSAQRLECGSEWAWRFLASLLIPTIRRE